MTFAQYLKIETSLGGIGCTDKQFIQACHDYMLSQVRRHNIYRAARHAFIRDGLTYLNRARADAFYQCGLDCREMTITDAFGKPVQHLPPSEAELKHAWFLNGISKWI